MIHITDLCFTYENQSKPSLFIKNLEIKKGECIVITGASGNGKSTFTKTINALIPHFFEGQLQGSIFLDNKNAREMNVCQVSQIVASVFQDPASQFFTDNVDSELAFTCENFGLERSVIVENMAKAVNQAEIEDLLGLKLQEISGGQKQKVAIATALTLPIKILLLDEPSSNLDYHSIEVLAAILKKLKEQGFTIIIAEHRLYYLTKIVDRVLYMREGKIDREYSAMDFLQLTPDFLQAHGLRSFNLFSNYPEIVKQSELDTKIASFKNISYIYPKAKNYTLQNIAIDCNAGDVIALIGKNGTGKTTLARILTGLYKSKKATFLFKTENVKSNNLYNYVNFVMQDVSYQLFGDTVFNELKIGNDDIENIDKKINDVLKHLELEYLKDEHPFSLSMGQRQRLVLATTYIRQTPLTILDEPTSGLDFLNMQRMSMLLKQMAKGENAIIIVTHDYEFICKTCNRILLLENGTITEDFYLKNNDSTLKHIFLEKLGS